MPQDSTNVLDADPPGLPEQLPHARLAPLIEPEERKREKDEEAADGKEAKNKVNIPLQEKLHRGVLNGVRNI